MLRVLVLGELVVEVDGRPVPLPDGRPARALLGYLALHPGPHARAALAARLWPDVLDASARTSLRGALADVRRALGAAADGHLVATRGEVGLRGVETDAADAADAPPAAALALWRGPLLDGLEAGDWLDAAREHDRATRGALLSALADAAAAAGDHAGAVARARERVALEPLSEEAHRELIARLAAAGDRAAALTAYERLAERLRRELRIAPSAPTRALVAEIRGDGAAAVAAPARPALPAAFAARRERSPFVGRDAARDRLLAALDDVRGGERRVVVVSGEPGIGKSRLAAEAARAAYDAGATVLAGRCHEEPIGPFAPFVEALRPLGELRAEPAADPGAARLRLFDEVAGLLARRSRGASRPARPRRPALGRSGDAAAARPPGRRAGAGRAAARRHVPPDRPRPRSPAVRAARRPAARAARRADRPGRARRGRDREPDRRLGRRRGAGARRPRARRDRGQPVLHRGGAARPARVGRGRRRDPRPRERPRGHRPARRAALGRRARRARGGRRVRARVRRRRARRRRAAAARRAARRAGRGRARAARAAAHGGHDAQDGRGPLGVLARARPRRDLRRAADAAPGTAPRRDRRRARARRRRHRRGRPPCLRGRRARRRRARRRALPRGGRRGARRARLRGGRRAHRARTPGARARPGGGAARPRRGPDRAR